jgi:hypothetical protein
MPSHDRGLLALLPGGRLAAAEARVVARATGIRLPRVEGRTSPEGARRRTAPGWSAGRSKASLARGTGSMCSCSLGRSACLGRAG